PWAACGPPSTTPCPWRVWRSCASSSRNSSAKTETRCAGLSVLGVAARTAPGGARHSRAEKNFFPGEAGEKIHRIGFSRLRTGKLCEALPPGGGGAGTEVPVWIPLVLTTLRKDLF